MQCTDICSAYAGMYGQTGLLRTAAVSSMRVAQRSPAKGSPSLGQAQFKGDIGRTLPAHWQLWSVCE
jgi:hypothetical protein